MSSFGRRRRRRVGALSLQIHGFRLSTLSVVMIRLDQPQWDLLRLGLSWNLACMIDRSIMLMLLELNFLVKQSIFFAGRCLLFDALVVIQTENAFRQLISGRRYKSEEFTFNWH